MPTLGDVASRAGVSAGVVSKVLNNAPTAIAISEATRQRILGAAKQMGYVADARARLLRQGSSPMVGVLVGHVRYRLRAALLQAIGEGLWKRGKEPLVGLHGWQAEAACRQIETFRSYRTGGVIVVTGSRTPGPEVFDALRAGAKHCGPFVCIGFAGPHAGVSIVGVDVDEAYRQIGLLMAADGRRRVVYTAHRVPGLEVLGPRFLKAVKPLGTIEPEVHGSSHDDRRAFGREVGAYLKDQCREGTIGVMTENDLDAFVLMDFLTRNGVRVPEDVAVVGSGDDPDLTRVTAPAITSFDAMGVLPAIAETAVRILCETPAGAAAPAEAHRFKPELVVRESFVPVGEEGR